MNSLKFTEIASRISEAQLAHLLEVNGWEKFGGQTNMYSRWRPAGREAERGLLLPQNDELVDYSDLFAQAVAQAWKLGDSRLRTLLERAATVQTLGDEMKFHKEARTYVGTIQWLAGEDLHAAARKSMTVAAKSRKSKLAYFGNSNAHLARSFLESVLMGQTEVGSYVVTAYAPPAEIFTEKKIRPGDTLPATGTHTGRDITRGLVDVLQTTREVVDHYANTGSSAGFVDNVNRGFCFEITQAVRDLVRDSDGAEVGIEMNVAADLFEAARTESHKLEFSPADYPVLETAGNILAATSRPQQVTVVGAVTLLERPQFGRPGLIRVDVLSGSTAKKMRVRLKSEDYDLAMDAHRDNMAIKVTGRQEIEGRYYWLYDPERIELIPMEVIQVQAESPSSEQHPLF
ncbi:hypothetical protein [Streptomyces sp. NBC_01750]|uniref:hypothetical protein n=1 Tax=Streptomyces sp. NBC_01750 TaxID=2975928 RepID=UPI002DDA62C6|nr:hypothetical protein [Streptomyces sp. NBC_01750]WSD35346.1 hypothetical protein OG966_27710 [Streptomyces sp. NBC_01750]